MFAAAVQDFFLSEGGKKELKKRGWSSHDIIKVNGLPW